MKANVTTRVIILSILLMAGFVINAGYVVSGQTDTELEGDVNVKTARGWNEKGISFMMSGEYERAIECFNKAIEECGKAIELDPNNIDAYSTRGFAYAVLNQYEAIWDFNRVIGLNPNYTEAYYWRDIALSKLEKQKLTPGFEAIFAITGLLAVACLLRSRKSNGGSKRSL